MDELTVITDEREGDHVFKIYEWDNSEGWRDNLIEKVGAEVRELYTNKSELKEVLEAEKDELGFDVGEIENRLENILDSVPSEEDGGILSTPRSDFPEILSAMVLKSLYSTDIPVDLLENKDTPDLPSRSTDIIGYERLGEDDQVHLILSEVKGTSDSDNPPAVIDKGDDSVKEQLKDMVQNDEVIKKELNLMFRQAKDEEDKRNIAEILSGFLGPESFEKVILCPFIVRELEEYGEEDYKVIKEESDEYEPYRLRFLAVCVDDSIDNLSTDVYQYASGGEE